MTRCNYNKQYNRIFSRQQFISINALFRPTFTANKFSSKKLHYTKRMEMRTFNR